MAKLIEIKGNGPAKEPRQLCCPECGCLMWLLYEDGMMECLGCGSASEFAGDESPRQGGT